MRALLLFAFAAVLAGSACAGPPDYPAAMSLAVKRWQASQRADGLLLYGFDFLKDEEAELNELSDLNLVRQAHTASVLADYLLLSKEALVREPLQRMLGAFRDRSRPFGKGGVRSALDAAHVLTTPVGRYKLRSTLQRAGILYETNGPGAVVMPGNDYSQALTGATALALLAELRYREATGDDGFADARRRWSEALVALRIPGNGFRSEPTSIDPNPYSDAQAWLALSEYDRLFPGHARVHDAVRSTDDDLLARNAQFTLLFFHWGAMAAAARYRATQDPKFVAFIGSHLESFLAHPHVTDDNGCAWAEGVADGLATLVASGAGDSPLATKARAWLAREMEKAERLQIRPGQERLTYSRASIEAVRMREFAGDFLQGLYTPRTQVDLTAHCVSAMVKIARGSLLR